MSMKKLTDAERDLIASNMPGGVEGYCQTWGWRHFAEAIEEKMIEKNRTPAERALQEIRDLHDGEEDIDGDGDPNRAMRVNQIIDAVL